MPQCGYSRLESSIVVGRHLRVLHFRSVIFEVVIAIRAAYQSSVQHMRIGICVVVVPPVTARRSWWAATGSVVWSLKRVLPKADYVAAPAVSEHVMNLLPCKLSVRDWVEAQVSGKKRQESCIGGKTIAAPGFTEHKAFWRAFDGASCNKRLIQSYCFVMNRFSNQNLSSTW